MWDITPEVAGKPPLLAVPVAADAPNPVLPVFRAATWHERMVVADDMASLREPDPLELERVERIEEAKALRDEIIFSGFSVRNVWAPDPDAAPRVWFDSDDSAQRNINGRFTKISAKRAVTYPMPWTDANNQTRLFENEEQFLQVGDMLDAHVDAAHKAYSALKFIIGGAPNPAAVDLNTASIAYGYPWPDNKITGADV